jgi:hypothetical protein
MCDFRFNKFVVLLYAYSRYQCNQHTTMHILYAQNCRHEVSLYEQGRQRYEHDQITHQDDS